MRNFNKGTKDIQYLLMAITGLKDHILPEKRLSSVPSGAPTQLANLSNRKQEEPLDQTNYLHPKKPPARMSIYPVRIVGG